MSTILHHPITLLFRTTPVRNFWGLNNYGQLGYGNTNRIGDDETPASAGDVDVGGRVVQLAAGGWHVCALLDTGAVRCWGYNGYSQLGYDHRLNIGDDEVPATAGDANVGGGPISRLVAGIGHTCVLLERGTVRCWGKNSHGQLGYAGALPSSGGVNVGGRVVQLIAGAEHTCALLETGAVRCWGFGMYGALGYGNTLDIGDDEKPSLAGDVPIGAAAVAIAAGANHTCARLGTGALRCWGANWWGQLGLGHTNHIGDDELPSSVPAVQE